MNTITKIGPFYEKLVRKFIVNVSIACNDEEFQDFIKFYVRGKSQGSNKTPLIDKNANEITVGQMKKWPNKGLLLSRKLSVN